VTRTAIALSRSKSRSRRLEDSDWRANDLRIASWRMVALAAASSGRSREYRLASIGRASVRGDDKT
jgi:hypothetical protein